MKKYVVVTQSESGDDYFYVISHTELPTYEQVNKWLLENGNDVDEDEGVHYECIRHIIDVEAEECKPLV